MTLLEIASPFGQPVSGQDGPSGDEAAAAEKIDFLRVAFDRLSIGAAVSLILSRPAEAPFAAVVTPNAAHIARIAADEATIGAAYRNAWLRLNDSRVIEFLALSRGLSVPAVPGADLVPTLLADPRFDRSAPIVLIGGDATLFDAFVARTGLTNARHFDAPMGLLKNPAAFEATVDWIENNPASFVLLAVGSPQQELIAEALRIRGRAAGVGLCVGASVEFMTGRRPRSPSWMSRFGLEWLFRLASEPRVMWRRYLVESPAIFRIYLTDFRR